MSSMQVSSDFNLFDQNSNPNIKTSKSDPISRVYKENIDNANDLSIFEDPPKPLLERSVTQIINEIRKDKYSVFGGGLLLCDKLNGILSVQYLEDESLMSGLSQYCFSYKGLTIINPIKQSDCISYFILQGTRRMILEMDTNLIKISEHDESGHYEYYIDPSKIIDGKYLVAQTKN